MIGWSRLGSWLVGGPCLTYFGLVLWDGIHKAGEFEFVPSALSLVLSVIFALVWISMLENYWTLVLRNTRGITVADRDLIRWSFAKSYLSRYAPGKLWPLVIRVSDLSTRGVNWTITVKASLIEQGGFILGSAIILLISAPLLFAPMEDSVIGPTALGVVIAALLFGGAICFLRGKLHQELLAKRLLWLSTRLFQGPMASFERPSDKELLFALFLGIMLALFQAISCLPLVLELMPDAGSKALLIACLAYPSARFIGQLASFSPGGLGVREGVFVGMVTSILPAPSALLLALWLRLVSVVTELCYLAIAGGLYYYKRPKP